MVGSETRIYVEGGGGGGDLRSLCREAFQKLLKKQGGFDGRLPRIVACGSRAETFESFKTSLKSGKFRYVAMLVDSEDPVGDHEATWSHLANRDGWKKPPNAKDEQVLLMATCMETWIMAAPLSLSTHYRNGLQKASLLPVRDIEQRDRHDVQQCLELATRNCKSPYCKGKRSFAALASIQPSELSSIASYQRMIRILNERLA